MALFPCSIEGHRYHGPQRTMYPAIVGGAFTTRGKLRLCQPHYADFLDMLDRRAEDVTNETASITHAVCVLCGQDAEDAHLQFFVTVYGDDGMRRDFWAPLHDRCEVAAREDWALAVAST